MSGLRLAWCGVWCEWDVEGNSVVGALHGGLVAVYVRTAAAEVTSHRFEHDEANDDNCAAEDGQTECDEWVFHGRLGGVWRGAPSSWVFTSSIVWKAAMKKTSLMTVLGMT